MKRYARPCSSVGRALGFRITPVVAARVRLASAPATLALRGDAAVGGSGRSNGQVTPEGEADHAKSSGHVKLSIPNTDGRQDWRDGTAEVRTRATSDA